MAQGAQEVWVTVDGERFLVKVEDLTQRPVVAFIEGSRFEVEIEEGTGGTEMPDVHVGDDMVTHSVPAGTRCEVTAPMPGDIIQVHVKPGQAVKVGEPLCILDAMKMKNTIHAPQDGVIVEIMIGEGTSVEYGTPLFRLG